MDEACALTRTGDVWVFRGSSAADKAIRGLTNAPVNHVGMAVALDDLPPLMWHAELGRSLPDMWTGKRQRGVQLHDLRAAVLQWGQRYGQRGWVRQLSGELTRQHEDGLLRAIARLDGTPFPSTAALAGRWLPPVHTSGSERPSSACHISGGRSSMTTAIPTWLTGALVRFWMTRSAPLRPRKSHRSPVRVRSTAASSSRTVPTATFRARRRRFRSGWITRLP